jgi:hypothetical protein
MYNPNQNLSKISKYIYKLKNFSNNNKLDKYLLHFDFHVKKYNQMNGGYADFDDINDAIEELKEQINMIKSKSSQTKKLSAIKDKIEKLPIIKEKLNKKLQEITINTSEIVKKEKQLETLVSPEERKELEKDITIIIEENTNLKKEVDELKKQIIELTKENEAKPVTSSIDNSEELVNALKLNESYQKEIEQLQKEKAQSIQNINDLEVKIKNVLGKFLTTEQINRIWQ